MLQRGRSAMLAAVMSSIAHDDDRPGAFPRISSDWVHCWGRCESWLRACRRMKIPRSLRADIAALTERWIGDPTLTWIGLCRLTTMAEGDIYRCSHEPWNFSHNCTR